MMMLVFIAIFKTGLSVLLQIQSPCPVVVVGYIIKEEEAEAGRPLIRFVVVHLTLDCCSSLPEKPAKGVSSKGDR